MKREKIVPFVLGFVAGVLFMLLGGGAVGGVLSYTMYQRAQAARDRAEMEHRAAQEQAQEALQRALEAERRAKP